MTVLLKRVLRALALLLAFSVSPLQTAALAQSSVLPSGGGKALIDTSDTVLLLPDHQTGLFQTVKDISVAELRSNTVMLAKLATLLKIHVITTASEPNGPNGPLMPEIHQFAPHAVAAAMRNRFGIAIGAPHTSNVDWPNAGLIGTYRSQWRRSAREAEARQPMRLP